MFATHALQRSLHAEQSKGLQGSKDQCLRLTRVNIGIQIQCYSLQESRTRPATKLPSSVRCECWRVAY